MRKLVAALIAALIGLAWGGLAVAQDYPTRPITMIVPFPAGGATDTLARLLSEPASREPRPARHHRERGRRGGQHRSSACRPGGG